MSEDHRSKNKNAEFSLPKDYLHQQIHDVYVRGLSASFNRQKEFCRENEWIPNLPVPAPKVNNFDDRYDMSRGGRGGARGGMLKGATWDYDPEANLQSAPSALFPKHPALKKPRRLTPKERRQIANYKFIQEKTHLGPKYTQPTKRTTLSTNPPAKTFGETQFNSQYGGRGKADVDPFTAVETYSQKYDPPKRTLPELGKVEFDKSMFPEELWGTLEGEDGLEVRRQLGRAMGRKAAILESARNAAKKKEAEDKMEGIENTGAGVEVGNIKDKATAVQARIDALKLQEEEGEDEDEDGEEEEKDDDYEDDEDGGDYDAEQYFDDGAEDEDEGADGGEDY